MRLEDRSSLAARLVWVIAALTPAAGAAEPATERIVSLAPHLTELVFTVGAGERLVGVVEYSDRPEAALRIPRIGDSFRLDLERVAELDPDLVLAWESGNPKVMVEQLRELGYRVETLGGAGLAGVSADLVRVGELVGQEARARREAQQYLARVDALRKRYRSAPALRVFYEISPRPLYTVNGDHVISEVIGLCGGRNVFFDLGQLAPAVSLESVLERDPEVILVGAPMPAALDEWRRWPRLAATRHENIFLVDANLLARATPRIVDGVEQVCELLDRARKSGD